MFKQSALCDVDEHLNSKILGNAENRASFFVDFFWIVGKNRFLGRSAIFMSDLCIARLLSYGTQFIALELSCKLMQSVLDGPFLYL